MSHYRSNLRDIEFVLFDVFGSDAQLGNGRYEEFDTDTVRSILAEVDRMSREDLAASYAESDRTPPVYDPAARTVTIPESFKKSFATLMDSELWRFALPEGLGGTPLPPSVFWGAAELILGSNAAAWMYASGPSFASVIWRNGTDAQKRIAEIMIDRRWAATMVLTEPDAGSDVGAGATKAHPQPDGTWHIEGVKRFITSGEHDMSENIVHLVLARPVGVEGVGGPGTKGLSLFIVPKFRFDPETGELGGRNGVYATNVEKKMGLKVSSTCELTFGDGEPATGWLLGDVHDGIAQMFQVIEYARMMVGTKAIATLSSGYLNALDYAKERVQGADLTRATDKSAPRVTITHHPDVRRSLMTQKAYAEGMRALVLYTATMQDAVAAAAARGETDEHAERVNDLLLPIVKGYGSERSWVLLGSESLQTFGGSGFLQDYPLEQYVRDAKIDTLYEGTTAIQGQDFFFRKIVRDNGQAIGWLSQQIQQTVDDELGGGRLKVEREQLAKALQAVQGILGTMVGFLMSADERAEGGDVRNVYKVGQNTTRLLLAAGDLVVAWLLLRQAAVALTKLDGDVPAKDQAFYEGKVAAAQFFARQVLPRLASERAVAEATDNALMDLDEAAF
ncbi:acyl-CoA dehydrogenase [Jiangella aurantiaca]|uniref:Broad-specificity linear acyl-CoA dehydrogenase FadE5 n=1 Tax=Jiangella aurantiaca TaxID=2530373 RepID=A0A4R5AFT2_9ACTN|nr:acyl-CoA dehydrogenase [Jiangella aurantiaca]TDD70206.1 acyl-CoA dehydrogenase [Jiangella aurantiaca]